MLNPSPSPMRPADKDADADADGPAHARDSRHSLRFSRTGEDQEGAATCAAWPANICTVLEVIQKHHQHHHIKRSSNSSAPDDEDQDKADDYEAEFCTKARLPLDPAEYELLMQVLHLSPTAIEDLRLLVGEGEEKEGEAALLAATATTPGKLRSAVCPLLAIFFYAAACA